MILDRVVYDISAFASEHPGGAAVLQAYAGADGTTAFSKVPHSPDAHALLANLQVATLQDEDDEQSDAASLAKCVNVDDVKSLAAKKLTKGAAAYYAAGAEDGHSLQENLQVWGRYLLRPRVFMDVSNVDMSTEVLGTRLQLPIIAAPTALLRMAHDEGEKAVARSCRTMGAAMCLSTTASCSIEEVAQASPSTYRWFQLYVYKDRERTKRLVERAEASGYSALCLTVDLPVLGNRTSLKKIGFTVPPQYTMANVAQEKETSQDSASGVDMKKAGDRKAYVNKLYDQALTLELVEWLGGICKLPVVVKGVLREEDAVLAAAMPNVRGVVVSNHGGRQLDGTVAPLSALPGVAGAVRECNAARARRGLPPVEVYVDGGVRRGRDVFKALALGAKAVLLGRPLIWGLAAAGEDGVNKVLEMLGDELKTCMQLCGTQDVSQIDNTFIAHQSKM